jgi:hypothetical protein
VESTYYFVIVCSIVVVLALLDLWLVILASQSILVFLKIVGQAPLVSVGVTRLWLVVGAAVVLRSRSRGSKSENAQSRNGDKRVLHGERGT